MSKADERVAEPLPGPAARHGAAPCPCRILSATVSREAGTCRRRWNDSGPIPSPRGDRWRALTSVLGALR